MTDQIDVYKIGKSPEELQRALIDLRSEYDTHIHDGVSSKTFQTVVADTVSTRTILIRKLSYADPTGGLWAGLIENIMVFNLGNATDFLKWNGSSLSISGNIGGGSITIGTNAWHVDSSGNMWWGSSATYTGATIKISNAGVANLSGLVVGTNVNIGTAAATADMTTIVGGIVTTSYLNAREVTVLGAVTAGSLNGVTMSIGSSNSIFKADSNGISLGNATFALAPFNVNMTGDVTVSSLRRKDFHWFTVFESMDGYSKTVDVGGAFSIGYNGVTSATGTTIYDLNTFEKYVLNNSYNQFTWDKRRSISFCLEPSNVTDKEEALGMGDVQLSDNRVNHVGFYFLNNAVYGSTGDSTTATLLDLSTTLSINTIYNFKINYIPGVGAEFFISGVSKGTMTTDLPSGDGNADILLGWYNQTNTTASNNTLLSYYDFWQAN